MHLYGVLISDNGFCEIHDSITIQQPDFPLQVSANSDSLFLCYGSNSGIASATATGGTPWYNGNSPYYSYEWFDGSYTSIGTDDSISGLVGGSYFVKVTDANGCDTFSTLQVLQVQTPLQGQNQIFGVACKGDNTGMIVSQATGSQGPYRYYWFSPSGDSIIMSNTDQFSYSRDSLKNLFAGTYNLHLYDKNGCFESYTITVGEPSVSLSIDSILVSSTIACYGENTGGAQAYVSGGMPNYYYQWDNGETTSHAGQLTSGYHTIELTDDWGCLVKDSVYIYENSEIISSITLDNEISCYGFSDGVISVTSVGGSPSYTYFWSNGVNTTTNSGLSYGSYYLTTQDIYGCEVFDTIFVSQPDPLFVEASEIDSISCYGYNDGLAYAYGLGGTPPYSFYWDSLTGYLGDTNSMMTPGVHTVYLVDSKGCQTTDTVYTHEPDLFEIFIIDSLTIHPYCIGVNTASLTSHVIGGTSPYTYEWDDNQVVPQTTPVAVNLLAGIYTVTATDSRGCVVSATSDIDSITNTMTAAIFPDSNTSIYYGTWNVSCYGANDATLYVLGDGTDHGPFTYQWVGPNGFTSNNDTISSVYAGLYSVTVFDSNYCSVNRGFNVTSPLPLEYTTMRVERDESCEGSCNGQIILDVTGGTVPYTGVSTNINSGIVLTSVIRDSVLPNMCSGTWNISVTDTNGCSATLMPGGVSVQTVGYNLQTVAQISNTVIDIDCYGDSTGFAYVDNPISHPNYTYVWESLLDPNFLVEGDTLSNVSAGSYILLAQYSDTLNQDTLNQMLPYEGCTSRDTVEIMESDEIVIQALVTDVSCNGNEDGEIDLIVNGGTSPYTYLWSTGTGSQNLTNLDQGNYTVTLTDNKGCTKMKTFNVDEPSSLSVTISKNGAILSSSVNGGVPGYIYRWYKYNNSTILQGGTSNSYMVLNPGSYYVEVTDANGCEEESDTITFLENTTPTSIIPEDSEFLIEVYPNPFSDKTKVSFGRKIHQGELKVVDILGNVVEIFELENQKDLIINRGTKSKGVYFVELTINNSKIFKKITIQ